jgi:hypothetical protein
LGVPVADRGGEHEIYPSNPQLREQSRTMIRHQVKTQDDVMLNAVGAGNLGPSGLARSRHLARLALVDRAILTR